MKILLEFFTQRYEARMSNHFLELLFKGLPVTISPLQSATDYCVPAEGGEVSYFNIARTSWPMSLISLLLPSITPADQKNP